MTYRERREAKNERLREWAAKREAKAAGLLKQNGPFRGDHAFNTQPGHIPERARAIARMDRAFENLEKAKSMNARADGIENQLDRSIYSDDPDAIEALEAKVTALSEKRDRMKASNAAYRKGPAAWAAFLGVSAEREAALRAKVESNLSWQRQPYPAYTLTNLGATIRQAQKRIEQIERRNAESEKAQAAGGITVTDLDGGHCRVVFAGKPLREILNALKAAGFWWSAGGWNGKRERLPEGIETKRAELEGRT